jgi:hypothetical protein
MSEYSKKYREIADTQSDPRLARAYRSLANWFDVMESTDDGDAFGTQLVDPCTELDPDKTDATIRASGQKS